MARNVAMACGGIAMGFAFAQPAMAQQAQQLEKVEITGSAIKRIDAESALPVTVITKEEIRRSGATTAADLINNMVVGGAGGYSVTLGVGDSARPGFSGVSMRGLGPDRTLILLNGRRMAVYAFDGGGVDVNAIPISALERVEILRDGASAIYGSDAIAGVINFITRKDYRGFEVSAGYEVPKATGGTLKQTTLTGGFGDLATNGYNVLAMIDAQKFDGIRSKDRSYAATGIRPDLGFSKTSGNTFPANAFSLATDAAMVNPSLPGCNPTGGSYNLGSSVLCRYDYSSAININPASERIGGMARGTLQIGADHQLFAELTYQRNKIDSVSSETPSVTTGKDVYVLPASSQFNPFGEDVYLAWRIKEAGHRTDQAVSDQSRALVGAEGVLFGWDYKTAFGYAESKADDKYTDGWLDDGRLRTALASGEVNPFGQSTAAGLSLIKAAKILETVRTSKSSATNFDINGSHEIAQLPGGPASIGVGYEYRSEKFGDNPSPVLSSGNIVGGGGDQQAVNKSRNINSVYAEVVLPLASKLELSGAVRYDNYSDFGNQTTPKVSLRWQPTPTILARASYGQGFRAPTLPNLYQPASGTNTGGNWNDPFYPCDVTPSTLHCDTQLTVLQSGNANLKAETSDQYSLGFGFEPTKDVNVTIDYFNIKLKNAITFVSADDKLTDWFANNLGGIYNADIVRDPATGYIDHVVADYQNVGLIHLAGFDWNVSGKIRTEVGVFKPSWEGTYYTKYDQGLVGSPTVSVLGQYATNGPIVRSKQALGLAWEKAEWSAFWNYRFQPHYVDYSGTRRVKAYELSDVGGTWTGIKNLSISLAVRNVFDRDPPASNTDDYFQVGFDPTYADVRGRTYTVRASYKFF
jgi:iron complex outermembrane receptor protein